MPLASLGIDTFGIAVDPGFGSLVVLVDRFVLLCSMEVKHLSVFFV